ncbi:uro-adherence factor A [Anabrus simplex]|uniref:uro-adherence factor A n=1 Tax=Anabrus simplex TaxID=316456 RepID=UPI0035A39BC6
MVGGKGSGFRIKGSTRVPVSGGIQSGHSQRQSKPDNQPNDNVLSNDVVNELTSTKENTESSTNISKPVEVDIPKRNSISENDLLKDDDSEKRNCSQIPSLLRFRSSSLCREMGVSKSRNTGSEDDRTSSQSIPDRSILSKFFRHGSEERSTGKDDFSTENKEGADGKKKTRRISRFLRPDFFDTPREESSFVKEKEAQKAAEEEKKKAKRIARRAALLEKKEKEAQKLLNDKETLKNECLEQTSNDKDDTYSEIQPSVREISLQSGGNDDDNSDAKFTSKPSDNTTTSNTGENAIEKSGNGTNNKNRFLHSLEKKWEKFRSSGDDSNSTAPCGKSRVEKAIKSLRERSVAPRGSDLMTTESNLLKRAVSVDDMCTKVKVPVTKGNNSSSSKLGSKVSSVLGLFRKMEDSPADVQKLPQTVNRPSLLLSRLRRTQSVYAGSHSDSVLHAHYQEMLDSSVSAAVVSESQGKDNANEFTESRNDSISNDVNLNSKTQKTVDSPVENTTVPTSAGIVIANPSTNVAVQNAEKSQKTHIKPLTSETRNGKSSNKVLGKTKVVKETSHQKESISLEKQKSGSTGISETLKSVSGKPVVRKSNPKKAIGSSSSSKVTSGTSDIQKVKSARLLDDGKDLVKCVKDVSKFDGKKGSLNSELLHNTQNIEENQQIVEKTVPPPLPTAASQESSVICEKEIKVPELKASLTLEPHEPHTENTTELIHETCSMQNKGAEDSLMQKNDTKRESGEESHETVNPKSEVDTQNCEKTPPSLTHDSAGHKVDSESYMVDRGSESTKSSLSPCIDSVNASEMKAAVVKKLDCCSKPSEEIATPVSLIDECESLDSWSVCSDFESRDFSMSPLPYPNLDEEATESVEDRIRRKSFYSRFNDVKKKSHRKLSPSYVGTQNYSAQQHYKNQGNNLLFSPQDLGYHAPSYSRQTSLPTRSHSATNNSTSTDNEPQSYELHNGFDDSSRDERKKSVEKNIKTDKYLNSEELKVVQTVPPSNKSSRSLSHSDVDKQLKTGPSHLLRPTDFTQDVIRRSSLSKSRLPTASWERRASTPVGSRIAILSNKSARAGKQADTTAPEGENLPLDGKYDRFTSESSPSS